MVVLQVTTVFTQITEMSHSTAEDVEISINVPKGTELLCEEIIIVFLCPPTDGPLEVSYVSLCPLFDTFL
jgi:hypothetical protein